MPNNENIITGSTIQDSPRFAEIGIAVTGFSQDKRKEDIDRYWAPVDQSQKRRRLFPAEYWKLDNLVAQGQDLAVVVKKIDDPFNVSIQWIAFDPEKPPVMNDNSRCFVLPRNYYDGIVEKHDTDESSFFIYGLKSINTTEESSNFLLVLLGQEEDGDYTIYFQNASANYINLDEDNIIPSPGGDGVGGVRVP